MLHKKVKMEINRQNYESYVLDYIEGTLPENMVFAVLSFLKSNPDIEEETKSLFDFSFKHENTKFHLKNTLKKNTHHDIPGISKFEQLSIAMLEKEINEDENKQLKQILESKPELIAVHHLLQKTKIFPDLDVHFKEKQQLFRAPAKKFIIPITIYSIAAGLLILLGFGIILKQYNNTSSGNRIHYTSQVYPVREIKKLNLQNFSDNPEKIMIKKEIQHIDSIQFREKNEVEMISSVPMKQIPLIKKPGPESIIVRLNIQNQSQLAVNDDYTPIQLFLKQKFNEKVLKQDKNEKFTAISLINAFGRFTNKVFHKKIEIEKTKNKHGELLYAIKTDNFDFYTKRNPNNKNNTQEADKSKKPLNQPRQE